MLLLCAISSTAQSVRLAGVVVNADDGAAVLFANLMVYSLPDSTLLGYAITSDSGVFSVEMSSSTEDVLVKVSCLGFKSQVIEAKTDSDSLTVRLKPDSQMLQTVVVTGRAPGIKVSGDTIDYNIAKYTTGNEKVLKDILAKLPGMDVDEKGQVTVNGEAVKKILIDGQDFFGNQNEQITNNLPANAVEKIQLQKNYSEFSLLSGFNTRRANALNVKIDSLHRGRMTGNAEVLGGWPGNYRGVVNAYSFGSKAMMGFNAKYFNTGEEVMTLIDYVKLLGSVNDYARSFGGQDRVLDNGISLPSFLQNNINSYDRRNALISSNVAWNPNERLKLNAYYLFNAETSKGKYDISRTYQGQESPMSFAEKADTRQYFHHFGLNMKYMLAGKAALDSRTTVTAMPQHSDRYIERYECKDRLWEWDISQRMSLVKNWNNRHLLSLSGELEYHNRRRRLEVASEGLLYDIVEDVALIRQTQKNATLDAFLSVSWSHRLSKVWQMDMSGGWNLIRNGLSADASLNRFCVQSQHLTTTVYDYSLSVSKKKGLFRLNSGLTLANISSRLDNIKKGFRLPLTVTLKSTLTNSLYQSAYQGILSDNRFSQMDGSLALTSKFKSLLNVELGYNLVLQQSKIGINDQRVNFAEHEIYLKPMLMKKERFELNVPVSFVIDHSGHDEFQNFDLGLSATYNVRRWSFAVEGRNMLHTQNYRRLRIELRNDYNEIITENRLPGYIIAGAKFMF